MNEQQVIWLKDLLVSISVAVQRRAGELELLQAAAAEEYAGCQAPGLVSRWATPGSWATSPGPEAAAALGAAPSGWQWMSVAGEWWAAGQPGLSQAGLQEVLPGARWGVRVHRQVWGWALQGQGARRQGAALQWGQACLAGWPHNQGWSWARETPSAPAWCWCWLQPPLPLSSASPAPPGASSFLQPDQCNS